MSLYEGLLAIHVLAAATWFGSGLAIGVIGSRLLAHGAGFGHYTQSAGWWAGRAHPAAGVVLLLTAFGMVADADLSLGEPWLSIALAGLVIAMGLSGAVIGPTAQALTRSFGDEPDRGTPTAEQRRLAARLVGASRLETLVVGLVIIDMVVKPGA